MATGSIDRRVTRTRAALQHAMMSLILNKPYDAITIEDICATADVGRSTFYAHYAGKDDLKRRGLEGLRRQLMDRQRSALNQPDCAVSRRFAFSLALFEHARDHLDHYRALAKGHGASVALGAIREVLCDLVRAELAAADAGSTEAPRDLTVQFVVGGLMAVLTWWLDGGAKLPPQRIDAIFRRWLTAGVPTSPLRPNAP
jgi:AcrR family transcriptional regulator